MPNTVQVVDDVVMMTLDIESLDSLSADAFRQDVEAATGDIKHLQIDLQKVGFVDSTGIGAIVACLKQLRAAGGDLRLTKLQPCVRSLFELVRIHRLIDLDA